ncbi:MAG: hypothetical protein GY780_15945 [bacterium]|nr:hypothetical protein [bacterium]
MNIKLLLFLAFIFALQIQAAFAIENVRFKRLSVVDGLSQSSVEAIVQDQEGFIWIGTEDGLNRYDGYSFKHFRHDPDDPSSIATSNVMRLHLGNNGQLWVGTYSKGLDRYDPQTETFTHFPHDPLDPNSLSGDRVRSICEDATGTLWVGTLNNGLNRLDPGSQKFVVMKHDPNSQNSLLSDRVRCVYPDPSGLLWIATNNGFSKYDPVTGQFEHFQAATEETENLNTIQSNDVRYISGDENGLLWIATTPGLSSFNPETGRFRNFRHDPSDPGSLSSDIIRTLYIDHQNRIWVGTNRGGLNLYDRQSDSFHAWWNDQADLTSLSNNSARVIFQDNGGLLWVGTFGGGLNIFDPRIDRFRHYEHDVDDQNSLNNPTVWAISEGPQGRIWFGVYSPGLDRYDRSTDSYEHDLQNQNHDQAEESRNFVRHLYWDRDGLLWVGNGQTGLDLFNPRDGSFQNWVHKEGETNSLGGNNIRDIIQDEAGDIWIATSGGGLDRFEPGNEVFSHFRNDPDNPKTLSNNQVISIHQDSDGAYWAGTVSGLNRIVFKPGSGPDQDFEITRFFHDPADSRSISNNYILSIFESQNGDLWFGSMQGLSRLRKSDRSDPVFTRWFMKDGLPNDVIYGILEDSGGRLWLSTNFGISRFNPETGVFRNFDTRDGLQTNEFNTNSYTKTSSGSFIFGGVKGASEFHPDQIVDSDFMPPVVLTGFNIFDEPANFDVALNSLDTITLSHSDNYFSFEFASLDFSSPERNRYQYMLEGLDGGWTRAGTRHFAGYTHVGHGEYVFRVRGTNSDGVWNELGTSIRIIITPPFWKTWWFILILIVAIVGGVSLLVTNRVKQLLAIERLRSKIAADLHDEIGNGLTEISIMCEIILQKLPADALTLVQAETQKIGLTSRELISNMSDIVWLVNPRRDSLYDLISRLGDSFKERLDAQDVQFKTENLDSLESIRLKMEYRQHLLLIFKEAINNCLKYGKCSMLTLRVNLQGKELTIELIDDGKGFDVQTSTAGNGLQNMKDRARRIGGSMTISSSANTGTKVKYSGTINRTIIWKRG